MPSTDSTALDIPAHIKHFERMIRYAENKRMAAFLADLVRKLSDPSHVPTGKWNQPGPWGHTDVNIVPAWIRLDFYDEHRILRCMSWEQKVAWGELKERSRRTVERRHKNQITKPIQGEKRKRILKALQSGKWISVPELMQKSGCVTNNAIQMHVLKLRESGHLIRYRWNRRITECRLGEGSSENRHVSTLTPRSTDTRLVTSFKSGEWMSTERLMAICDCSTIHALEQRITRLRKLGYLIDHRRNSLTQMREYLLVRSPGVHHVSALTPQSKDQVPVGQTGRDPSRTGSQGDLNETTNNNHNPGNG